MCIYFSFSGSCGLLVIWEPVPLRKGSTVATNLWLSTCKLLEQVHYIHKLLENIRLRASPNQIAPVVTSDHVPEVAHERAKTIKISSPVTSTWCLLSA